MAIISPKQLSQIRKKHEDKKIVFCSGTFDLTHAGHALFFEDCKKHGDILVVGVGKDATIKKLKGRSRPVLNEHVRLYTVALFKAVDYCFLEPTPVTEYPLTLLSLVMKKLQPDFYVINKDAFDIPYRRKVVSGRKTKLIIMDRRCPPEFENISTTGIIEKVKKS